MNSRISVSGLCFPSLDLVSTVDTLQEIGAGRTTLQARKFRSIGWGAGIETVRQSGIEVAGLVASYPETLADRATWDAIRADLTDTVDAAVALGSPMIYNVTGPLLDGGRRVSLEAYAELIEPVVSYASDGGVAMAVEPTLSSFAWVSFVHSLAEVQELDSRTGLGVCLDLRHVWDDPGFQDYLNSAIGRVALVQVGDTVDGADGPEPAVPGDGVIPLAERIDRIEKAGYDGIYDLELVGPRIDIVGHVESVRRGVALLESIL
ncbi:sugar phosphate isomerase/epimerase [Rhodococcus sp. 14-2470-1a]|uniref:sugar phosphate isomerase/epimerase family protein n=1 Tax=Rhodococcus sp. 14-2470-1a TaxID=2023150 RepID=UPI0015C63014|nr:TIM barrel protein [Rhodococcus sp. 14-2470-1a]